MCRKTGGRITTSGQDTNGWKGSMAMCEGEVWLVCLVHARIGVVPLEEGRSLRLLHAVGSHAHPPPLILKLVYGQLSHQASQVACTSSRLRFKSSL